MIMWKTKLEVFRNIVICRLAIINKILRVHMSITIFVVKSRQMILLADRNKNELHPNK